MSLNFINNLDGKLAFAMKSFVLFSAMALTHAYADEDDHDHDHEEEHGHGHSDVEFLFTGGEIEIEFSDPGFRVFEGDIDEGQTDDPGFNNDEFLGTGDVPAQGSILAFNVLGPLVFWDGDSFEDAGLASLTILDASFNALNPDSSDISTITGTTVSDIADFNIPTNYIGTADASGEIHQHIDFILTDGDIGAYGIMMSLTTDEAGIDDSAMFGLFFNNGLGEEAFEEGVDAFNAQVVPVPAAAWLFMSAIGLVAARSRRS